MKYNGTTYYYITNLQGDVMYLIDASENTVAAYEYDPYGNIVSATGSMAEINPLRYRGYYYDAELEMYYLQSRYYDPAICRFINADVYASTGQSMIGHNMFAYCYNDPVNNCDTEGMLPNVVIDGMVHDPVLDHICLWNSSLTRRNTYIYYNRKNIWGGFGYCDLYNKYTGEVWELKKHTVPTWKAQAQLNKYVGGRLKHNKSLNLTLPYTTIIPSRTFEFSTGLDIYHVWYWYEGDGILRYNYYSRPTTAGCVVYATIIIGAVALQFAGVPAWAII